MQPLGCCPRITPVSSSRQSRSSSSSSSSSTSSSSSRSVVASATAAHAGGGRESEASSSRSPCRRIARRGAVVLTPAILPSHHFSSSSSPHCASTQPPRPCPPPPRPRRLLVVVAVVVRRRRRRSSSSRRPRHPPRRASTVRSSPESTYARTHRRLDRRAEHADVDLACRPRRAPRSGLVRRHARVPAGVARAQVQAHPVRLRHLARRPHAVRRLRLLEVLVVVSHVDRAVAVDGGDLAEPPLFVVVRTPLRLHPIADRPRRRGGGRERCGDS